jgi:hypothetical protein
MSDGTVSHICTACSSPEAATALTWHWPLSIGHPPTGSRLSRVTAKHASVTGCCDPNSHSARAIDPATIRSPSAYSATHAASTRSLLSLARETGRLPVQRTAPLEAITTRWMRDGGRAIGVYLHLDRGSARAT